MRTLLIRTSAVAACLLLANASWRVLAWEVLPRITRATLNGIWEGVYRNHEVFRLDVSTTGPAILVTAYDHGRTTSVFIFDQVTIQPGGKLTMSGTRVGDAETGRWTIEGEGEASDRVGVIDLKFAQPNTYGRIQLEKTDGKMVEQLARASTKAQDMISKPRVVGVASNKALQSDAGSTRR